MLKPITSESADRFCSLVIGRYGLGKTCLARTMVGQEYTEKGWEQVLEPVDKVCMLSAESGLLSIRDLTKSGLIEGYEIGSFAEFKEAYQLLLSTQEMKDRYTWVFIDSLTEITDRCVEAMKEKYPNKSDSFNLWGDYTEIIKQLVKGFRDLKDYNVVFTCLETVEKDENNKRYMAPAIAGKELKEKLPSFFDEVLYLSTIPDSKGIEQRIFFTQPYNNYPAKDRSGKLKSIEKPNLLTIKNKILGD